MASLRRDPKSGNFFIRFQYAGRPFNRSLKTKENREAQAIRGRIAETLLLLERGRLKIPEDADPAVFILSDGKLDHKPMKPKVATLIDLFQVYNEEIPDGAKDSETLKGEQIHHKHILRHLRGSTSIKTFSTSTMPFRRVPVQIQCDHLANGIGDSW
jgi:hypothetical protein